MLTNSRFLDFLDFGVLTICQETPRLLNPANSYCILGADSDYHIHTVQQLVISCTVGVQRDQKCKNMYKKPFFLLLCLSPVNVTYILKPLNIAHFEGILGADSENHIHTGQI